MLPSPDATKRRRGRDPDRNERSDRLTLRPIALSAAIASMLLGSVVVFGWLIGHRGLIQIAPTFVPMQYNTALGFVVAGAALLGLMTEQRRLTFIASASVTVIGALTLLQYMADIDLRIDQLLMEHYITAETSHPIGALVAAGAMILVYLLQTARAQQQTVEMLEALESRKNALDSVNDSLQKANGELDARNAEMEQFVYIPFRMT